jgi:PAS domain S-box-containing protein
LLTASEFSFQALSDFSSMGVFHADSAGSFTHTNLRWREIFGLSLGESLGMGWRSRLHSADRDKVTAQWQNCIATGSDFDLEFRLLRSAEVVDVRARARAIHCAEASVAGYVGVVEDVSAPKLAEGQLRRANALLETMLQSLPCGSQAGSAQPQVSGTARSSGSVLC